MWPFKKSPKREGKPAATNGSGAAVPSGLDPSSREGKAYVLMQQIKATREAMGPETLERIARKMQHDQIRGQMQSLIEQDEQKRQKLIDEIRFQIQSDR